MSIVNIDERREEVEYDCRGMTEGFFLQSFFPMNSSHFAFRKAFSVRKPWEGTLQENAGMRVS